MHGVEVYVKEGLPFLQKVSLENSEDSYLFFRLALLHSLYFLFFSPAISVFIFVHGF